MRGFPPQDEIAQKPQKPSGFSSRSPEQQNALTMSSPNCERHIMGRVRKLGEVQGDGERSPE